ncbi:MAG: recombinase family protein [Gammaproteobacteria bacterium]|nr:recombinase family protein [Gammaproteobacteria bacterium]
MKTTAYLRVSTNAQDLNNQKLAILDLAHKEGFQIDEFIEMTISSRRSEQHKQLSTAIDELTKGDLLVVSELSRLGRSLGQVITIIDSLVKREIRFIAIKESIRFEGKHTLQSKVMTALFALFSEVERDLISERTCFILFRPENWILRQPDEGELRQNGRCVLFLHVL